MNYVRPPVRSASQSAHALVTTNKNIFMGNFELLSISYPTKKTLLR